MKHIKLFESFLLEGTGLVTGKYDIDLLSDFLTKIPVNWSGNSVVAEIHPKGSSDKDNIYVSLNKDGGFAKASANNKKRNISIKYNQDIQYMRMMVAHELSHMLDIGIRVMNAKYPNRRDFDNSYYKLTPEEQWKNYISDETEREAWASGLVYVINSLLIEQPEKIEAVKELIRNKDWHIEKVFPELQNIINDFDLSYTFSTYGKIRERFFKRLASSIITHKKGEIMDIKAVIIDDSDDETIIRVKPIKPERPTNDNYYATQGIHRKYESDLYWYEKGIETIERNRLVKKAADEMNIETVTIKSKIATSISEVY